MKLIERYKTELEPYISSKDNFSAYAIRGFIWMDERYKELMVGRINKLSIYNLYAHIIVGMYDAGYLKDKFTIDQKDHIERIRYYLENKKQLISSLTEEELIEERKFVNSYYGKIRPRLQAYVCEYVSIMWKEILQKNKNVIYADTDMAFYFGEINLFDINFPYEVEKLDALYLLDKKKYIYSIDNIIKNKSYDKRNPDALNKMKIYIRNKKLGELLNETTEI